METARNGALGPGALARSLPAVLVDEVPEVQTVGNDQNFRRSFAVKILAEILLVATRTGRTVGQQLCTGTGPRAHFLGKWTAVLYFSSQSWIQQAAEAALES
jgi:hypothetical protein